MSGLVVSLWLAIQIDGAGTCPTTTEIQRQLAPLLPSGGAIDLSDRARIAESADGLDVALARSDGRTVARRRLPRSGTCAEQAETVAVTLAVWEAQIHPEIALRLDRLGATPTAGTAATVGRAGAAPTVARAAEPAAQGPGLFAVGAAVVGSWQPGSIAPGGRVDVTRGTAGGSWRARLSLAALGRHTMSLPPGEATWWRLYAAAGTDYVLSIGAGWQVTLGAAGVLGAVMAAGSGYSNDRTTRSADVGVETLARAELPRSALRPWLGVALLTWLRRQDVVVTGQGASAALPRFEGVLALGADFCWRL
jgi:hypothetical protein